MVFSDNSINPSEASGTTALSPLHLCGRVGWEGGSSTGSFASRAFLWSRWLLKHLTNRETGERATPASVLGKGTLNCREVLPAVYSSNYKSALLS